MKIHWLQHVPFEGLGYIGEWAEENGNTLHCTRFYAGDALPAAESCDFLIVMGGPMGVHDNYPWLKEEIRFIRQCTELRIPILGVCLGAQLLAHCLGGKVSANEHKEIGWFDIRKNPNVSHRLATILPDELTVLHWHGDTFTIPPDALHLFSSEACLNQAFIHDENRIGIQFHLEIGRQGVEQLVQHCGEELSDGRWIQTGEELREGAERSHSCRQAMKNILDYLKSQTVEG